MKKILSLSLSLTLVACSSGLPELKYADGSTRIPINPRPIPLTITNQSTVTSQISKPGDAPAAADDTAKPAAKHGCRRPPEKAIGFEGFDKVPYTEPQSPLTLYR